MLTTHSEWVLEELANLVRLSDYLNLRGTGSRRRGCLTLSPDEVGVWLFEPKKRPKGSVVKEIPLDQELGGSASDDITTKSRTWARTTN